MKRCAVLLLVVIVMALLASGGMIVQASEMGARAYGMGGAFTAVADDVTALYWNPAGLTERTFELTADLGGFDKETVENLNDFVESGDPATLPENARIDFKTIAALGFFNYGIGAVVDGTASYQFTSDTDKYAEGKVIGEGILGGATKLTVAPSILAFRVGANVKAIWAQDASFQVVSDSESSEVTMTDWTGEGKGYALDAGVLVDVTPAVSIGAMVRNLYGTIEWERKGTKTINDGEPESLTSSESEKLQPEFRAGVAVRPPVIGGVVAADIETNGTLHVGFEKNVLFNGLSIRLGQIMGSGETTTTAGLGLNLGPLHADIAAGSSDGFKNYDFMVEAGLRF